MRGFSERLAAVFRKKLSASSKVSSSSIFRRPMKITFGVPSLVAVAIGMGFCLASASLTSGGSLTIFITVIRTIC
ncbi:MAG: hypothetical protein A4E30_00924 [Methanomassiliicoccales archaeon PtaB.Bin215]|nr:MAG: hypothetical protein A4E30_00924 [Methanomassiliicoccales archaeon PtaB.Bin215]